MVSYRYLGSALTNANGVATFDYQGTGAGEIDVLASLDNPITDGSIVSGTFSVIDSILAFDGSSVTSNFNDVYNVVKSLTVSSFYFCLTIVRGLFLAILKIEI